MKKRSYEHGDVTIEFDASRCIHAAECGRGLPAVFDPKRRPWIDPSRADADAIFDVVRRCPSGALTARVRNRPPEAADEQPGVRVQADGPVWIRGPIRLTLPSGDVLEETRLALCRCGRSRNKPYCDNSHQEAGFRDPGALSDEGAKAVSDPEPSPLELRGAPNGPLLVRGPVTVTGTDGRSVSTATCALCRCGESRTKPFCDGTHKRIDFRAD